MDIHFDYRIPSEEEIASIKARLMKEDAFKQRSGAVGEEQAERELDARLKEEVEYMIAKNRQGSEKLPLACVGDDPGCAPQPEN